ncbi:precorrin-6y C5,15-methyltransferase (decarboxylating) subunit CbiE [Microvirga antarctica]|uniref:precorrin-6y C5,15-methyltransferase (decarboxylating) subunit CbiE n=1 Tax=Microvirga antarctica TaxID=2819233 RepID=UPI001B307AEC|nr:precorrin-6y C5,15-methyltransferase (decarboxylating) subunit CbiE [Microvirga antarctica]
MCALSTNSAPLSRSGTPPWLWIVGIGEDGRAGLSADALAAIAGASLIVGGERHLSLAAPLSVETMTWSNPISDTYAQILARRGDRVCVLATGDPFHFGVGAELAKLIPANELICFPQPSAFSLAAARLGWSLPDCACISLHGRALERLIPVLQPGVRVLALSWDGTTPEQAAALLCARGFGSSRLTVLEAMGGPRERRLEMLANRIVPGPIDPLNVLAIEVVADPGARIVTLSPGLRDDWFENDGQLTKADMRAITLAALAPQAGSLLWDVGAGAGSVAIEWMLLHPQNRAIAVESRADRVERIGRNARHLGVPDLTIVTGKAPLALSGLPQPDAIFIGGGASGDGVLDACWSALKSGGTLVVNAVTFDTERMILDRYQRDGGTLKRIALSRLEPVGSVQGWRPAMPVTQWVVVKP